MRSLWFVHERNCARILRRTESQYEGSLMADQKDKAKDKKSRKQTTGNIQNDQKASGYKSSGGNMGAGKSGKENMGSEKPSDETGMGS